MKKSLEITSEIHNIIEKVSEFMPRYQCAFYIKNQSENPIILLKEDFDKFAKEGQFTEGPFRETFGDGCSDPYNPNRQAFGKLKDGRIIYCELSELMQEKVKSYLESIV